MTDLKQLLRDADPVRDEGELSLVDAQRMRRNIVSATLDAAPVRTPWQRPFAIAGVGALLVTVATMAGDRVLVRSTTAPAPIESNGTTLGGGSAEGDRRQLQFATPGGTRIIWIFDQNLRLQDSTP